MSNQARVPGICSHRFRVAGAKAAPENTIEACGRAVEAGFLIFETDVRRTKDGVLVVFHSDGLEETTNGEGSVGEITHEELKKLSAGIRWGQEFASERVPTLHQLLEFIAARNHAVLHLELKNQPHPYPGFEDDVIRELQSYSGKVVLSSFDHAILQRIKSKAPQYPTAFLGNSLFFNVGAYAKTLGASAWHPEFSSLTADAVKEAHAAGLEVNTGTVNTETNLLRAAEYGVDNVITDFPVLARRIYQELGQAWPP
jgi:glycerophosphoryl diester phosphodiesterase